MGLELLLSPNNGILPNLQDSIINYEIESERREEWEKEFNFWYQAMRRYSELIANKYKREFNELKNKLDWRQSER
mgnify:CR=1 FL=1